MVILGMAIAAGNVSGATSAIGAPDRLRLVVAVPDGELAGSGLLAGAEHEAQLALDWMQQQTGLTFRGDVEDPLVVDLSLSADELRGSSSDAFYAVLDEVRAATRDRSVLPVIVSPVQTETIANARRSTCGRGGPHGIVVFLGNCPHVPSTAAMFGTGVNRVIAHELVHALGGVADCAPNASSDGHVGDDPNDLMYDGPHQSQGPPVLDAANDDYWQHANEGCPDIADSPLWET